MAFIVGILLIILGSVALYSWWVAVIAFLKGLVVFSLLFWGLVSLIIGYAGWKAKRQIKTALNEIPTEDDNAPAPLSDETPNPTA